MKLQSKELNALKGLGRLARMCHAAHDATAADVRALQNHLDKVADKVFNRKRRGEQ